MRKIAQILTLTIISLSLGSCYNSRILVGSITPEEPVIEVNDQWNDHFIFGLVPGKNAKMNADLLVGNVPNYLIRTHTSFVNGLISAITFGIYTPTQTKFYIPMKDLKK